MSKSKLNGISPDEIIEEYGADTLRLYEMFMSPFDKEKLWNNEAISGCKRFLNRIYDCIVSDKVTEEDSLEALKLTHKVVHAVEQDIEAMSFNTAIAKMMEFLNNFTQLTAYPKSCLLMLVQALYSFAPHFAEECHQLLGESGSLTYKPYPNVNPSYLVDNSVVYVLQINGKVRGKLELENDLPKERLFAMAKEHENVSKYLEDQKILKEFFVPKKLINFVIAS